MLKIFHRAGFLGESNSVFRKQETPGEQVVVTMDKETYNQAKQDAAEVLRKSQLALRALRVEG